MSRASVNPKNAIHMRTIYGQILNGKIGAITHFHEVAGRLDLRGDRYLLQGYQQPQGPVTVFHPAAVPFTLLRSNRG